MALELMMFLGAAAILTAGCLVPNRWLPPLPNDKLMHFGAWAVLGLMGLRMADGAWQSALWLAAMLFGGWLIECLQSLVPDRAFCWRDMAANAAGLAFATVCTQLFAALA